MELTVIIFAAFVILFVVSAFVLALIAGRLLGTSWYVKAGVLVVSLMIASAGVAAWIHSSETTGPTGVGHTIDTER